MEENIISVLMDYRNQRRSYTINTDFSSKYHTQTKKKKQEYKKKEVQIGISNTMLKVWRKIEKKAMIQNGKKSLESDVENG